MTKKTKIEELIETNLTATRHRIEKLEKVGRIIERTVLIGFSIICAVALTWPIWKLFS